MRISDWSSDVCSSVLAVFLPGGHGAMWDFPGNRLLADLIGRAFLQGLVIGAVCHGPAGLLAATKGDDSPLVQGRRVNAFTNEEERPVGLDEVEIGRAHVWTPDTNDTLESLPLLEKKK